jgi:4-amino-4-deoxy-L-arabinose transferase-like glycosyltransferase
MRVSLWLDEAWVANSILSPSWKEMFYYPRWLQPTPPLFLALVRLLAKVLGPSEPALRLLPWLAGLMAIPVLAIALRKLFSPASALCGTSLVIVNFWAVKHSQQVKQFGVDVLACALIVLLVTRYCHRSDRRNFTLLVGGFIVMSFLDHGVLYGTIRHCGGGAGAAMASASISSGWAPQNRHCVFFPEHCCQLPGIHTSQS